MAWRKNDGITGSNNIPLGTRRRFGGDAEESASPADYAAAPASSADPVKRGRSPVRGEPTSFFVPFFPPLCAVILTRLV